MLTLSCLPRCHTCAGIEETWRFQQQDIVAAVETGAAAKVFDLSLPQLGPYNVAFSRSGRHMLLGGLKGHLAVMEWQQSHLTCEVQVRVALWAQQGEEGAGSGQAVHVRQLGGEGGHSLGSPRGAMSLGTVAAQGLDLLTAGVRCWVRGKDPMIVHCNLEARGGW